MGFFAGAWLGIRIWIWAYFIFSIVAGFGVALYWHRERIRKKYYEVRFPEQLLKVVIHYKTGFFREYWRLIPVDKYFTIDSKDYSFFDKAVLRLNDFYAKEKGEKTIIQVEGKKYNFNELIPIKKRGRRYPEIHYFFNVPNPISFDLKEKVIKLTSKELHDFKENDLFGKLLTLDTQQNFLMFLLILGGLNFLCSAFIIAKLMGFIK